MFNVRVNIGMQGFFMPMPNYARYSGAICSFGKKACDEMMTHYPDASCPALGSNTCGIEYLVYDGSNFLEISMWASCVKKDFFAINRGTLNCDVIEKGVAHRRIQRKIQGNAGFGLYQMDPLMLPINVLHTYTGDIGASQSHKVQYPSHCTFHVAQTGQLIFETIIDFAGFLRQQIIKQFSWLPDFWEKAYDSRSMLPIFVNDGPQNHLYEMAI